MNSLLRQSSDLAGESCGVEITIEGRVQGVGFRPFVNRLAVSLGLRGWVLNSAGQVEVFAAGSASAIERFVHDLVARAPPLARPRVARIRSVSPSPDFGDAFTIKSSRGGAGDAELPPDHFVCDDCLAEMADPCARRYRYPFINCTQCGPRYSIIRSLPYDRINTTMAAFTMCPACRDEYENPADRRYHAQPLACPACGPALMFARAGELVHGNEAALAACVQALLDGFTVAVKGIGGYHLVCDATRDDCVQRLRTAKRRPHKPFAVMVPTKPEDALACARELAHMDVVEESLLRDPVRPIVLVRRRANAALAAGVAPGLADIGLMLPYSPLHHLLLQAMRRPLVATSANVSGEPVLTDAQEIEHRLGHCCDAYLHHDRPIHRAADDPVVRVMAGRAIPVRLGRGTAPLKLELPGSLEKPVIASGGQMRTTVCVAWGNRAVVSPHIGDQGTVRSQAVFEEVAEGMQQLYGARATRVLSDQHPAFSTNAWARRQRLSLETVQHHHAHASALAGERALEVPALIFAWDGMGLGERGVLWGGEALYGLPGSWRRVGSFRPFRLVGGDVVSHEPWRSAAAICWQLGMTFGKHRPEFEMVRHAWERGINVHESCAVGRLFDAAAALLGVLETASYDGQAPAMLEAHTRTPVPRIALPIDWESTASWSVDWGPLFRALVCHGGSVAERADLFHSSLAGSILDQAFAMRRRLPLKQVGLTGGVFQNRRLTEEAVQLLGANGFEVLLHERVPPNDGGLSYGQIVEALGREQARKQMAETVEAHDA